LEGQRYIPETGEDVDDPCQAPGQEDGGQHAPGVVNLGHELGEDEEGGRRPDCNGGDVVLDVKEALHGQTQENTEKPQGYRDQVDPGGHVPVLALLVYPNIDQHAQAYPEYDIGDGGQEETAVEVNPSEDEALEDP